jgi:hypothetical protein
MIGLSFACRILVDGQRLSSAGGSAALLKDVCQFMRKNLGARYRTVRSSTAEHDVRTDRIGERSHLVGRGRGGRVGMDPYVAEIMSEDRFHGSSRPPIHGMAGAL